MTPDVRPIAPSPRRAPRPKPWRRAGAVAGSTLFHLGLLALMASSASGGLISAAAGGGGPQGPVMQVSLVGPVSAPAGEAAPEAGGQVAPLFAKYRPAADGVVAPISPTRTSRDFARLVDRFQRPDVPQPQQPRPDNLPDAPQARAPDRPSSTPSPVAAAARAADHPTPGETTGQASTGDLWGRIEPCWRNLATPGERPVTLEVSLNAAGTISRPPQVIRAPDAKLDEPRLRSEARALQALTGCLPRGDLRFARQVFRLEFRAGH
jgi:hypothetical protein